MRTCRCSRAVVAAGFRGLLFCRVMLIPIRHAGLFYPRRQKLQIKQIGRLDRRSIHQVHLLESKTEANANVPLLRKMIDNLFNSFTCGAVPGLSPAVRDRT